jgi:hypothetical protein
MAKEEPMSSYQTTPTQTAAPVPPTHPVPPTYAVPPAQPVVPIGPAQPAVVVPAAPVMMVMPKNGLGTAGFILALVGVFGVWIPVVDIVAIPLVILALIFAAIGTFNAFRGKATNKGLAIAGLVISVVALALPFLLLGAGVGAMSALF